MIWSEDSVAIFSHTDAVVRVNRSFPVPRSPHRWRVLPQTEGGHENASAWVQHTRHVGRLSWSAAPSWNPPDVILLNGNTYSTCTFVFAGTARCWRAGRPTPQIDRPSPTWWKRWGTCWKPGFSRYFYIQDIDHTLLGLWFIPTIKMCVYIWRSYAGSWETSTMLWLSVTQLFKGNNLFVLFNRMGRITFLLDRSQQETLVTVRPLKKARSQSQTWGDERKCKHRSV